MFSHERIQFWEQYFAHSNSTRLQILHLQWQAQQAGGGRQHILKRSSVEGDVQALLAGYKRAVSAISDLAGPSDPDHLVFESQLLYGALGGQLHVCVSPVKPIV